MPRAIPWSPGISFDLRGTSRQVCVRFQLLGLGDDSAECLLYKPEDLSLPHPRTRGKCWVCPREVHRQVDPCLLAAQPVQLIGEL